MKSRLLESAVGRDLQGFGGHDASRFSLPEAREEPSIEAALAALRNDQVILFQDLGIEKADSIIEQVALGLQLLEGLEVQAGMVPLYGHRQRVSKYFMSVDKRSDYQFILAHSEGQQRADIQLAAFYCFENSTDGGVTILLNTNDTSDVWSKLREVTLKIDLCAKVPSPAEIAQARVMHKITIPDDVVSERDQILNEEPTVIPGTRTFKVLAVPRKTRSRILGIDLNVYWDNISSTDFDSALEYLRLVERHGLLRQPSPKLSISELDDTQSRKTWHSGVTYEDLFKATIVRKLAPRELIIQNNLSWTHSCSNWTPGSGKRNVVAAFA
jgi:hypothetical protein